MTCREVSPLLYAERDGVLTPGQHADLDRHCAGCVDCQQLRADLSAAAAAWRADVKSSSVPDADVEWRKVQAMIHSPTARPKRKLAPIVWLSTPLAAAAAVALLFFVSPPSPPRISTASAPPPPPPPPAPVVAAAEVARADFVEAGDANAPTMVYVDKDSGWLVVWAADGDSKNSG
ncbi:MAG TPA: hypothetical protein VFJ90_10985 [Candidatus Didemnitutus sp.]|nr:hypothetical protein [Candidatus Didemnitutus sp.]